MVLASPAVAAQADERGRPASFEVADVVRHYGTGFLKTSSTSPHQRAVLRAIARCRTAALGGHAEQCDGCGHRRIAYNSCRDRHCPKCQGKERARWVAAEQALLLPVEYFHLVFTLPHVLNGLVRVNRRRLYDLLFRTAAATLRTFARDPRHLGAEPAITMVLHTWGQTLTEHVHVHCVVSGAGLSLDGTAWISLPKGKTRRRRPFLFPVAALSEVFRGKYIAALARLHAGGALRFAGQCAALADNNRWQSFLSTLWQGDWVVYAKPPFGGPETVLKYLSRYTHRVAISNRRITFVGEGVVRFLYRDYADDGRTKKMTIPATEFLRRFLLHIVPSGFMRIRHYGITANCHRKEKLTRARELLGQSSPSLEPGAEENSALESFGASTTQNAADHSTCPACGGTMRVVEIIPAAHQQPALRLHTPYDTS